MRTWIKICGLTSERAVAAAVDGGADAVGFVFHRGSPRHLEPRQARGLASAVPAGVLKVAVTRHPSQSDVDAILAAFSPDALQADLADFEVLRLPDGLARLPVLRTGEGLPATPPSRCVYESAESGRGERADWDEARSHARRTELVLAGGLSPANVAGAISLVRPFGVDVSSGVESAPGRKDAGLIRDFIAAARAAASA